MSFENAITGLICLAAAGYVGNSMWGSIKKAWAPKGSGCGGCGDGKAPCSTESPSPGSELIQLKRSTASR